MRSHSRMLCAPGRTLARDRHTGALRCRRHVRLRLEHVGVGAARSEPSGQVRIPVMREQPLGVVRVERSLRAVEQRGDRRGFAVVLADGRSGEARHVGERVEQGGMTQREHRRAHPALGHAGDRPSRRTHRVVRADVVGNVDSQIALRIPARRVDAFGVTAVRAVLIRHHDHRRLPTMGLGEVVDERRDVPFARPLLRRARVAAEQYDDRESNTRSACRGRHVHHRAAGREPRADTADRHHPNRSPRGRIGMGGAADRRRACRQQTHHRGADEPQSCAGDAQCFGSRRSLRCDTVGWWLRA